LGKQRSAVRSQGREERRNPTGRFAENTLVLVAPAQMPGGVAVKEQKVGVKRRANI